MSEKMKSVIRKITLNGATFDNEVIEPTNVNFFLRKKWCGKINSRQNNRGRRWSRMAGRSICI